MAEPRIQYCTTADGVSIAYRTLGEGVPYVSTPLSFPFSLTEREWQLSEERQWYERLGQGKMLVQYDNRGSGQSERSVRDYSLNGLVLDIEAVVNRLGLERFALSGWLGGGPLAITYAARHPEQVTHLILWCAWARMSDVLESAQAEGLLALLDKDWALFTEAAAHVFWGWSAGEAARQRAAFMRECMTQETFRIFVTGMLESDASALLSRVRSPTLVLCRRQAALPPADVAKRLASQIPDAQLTVLEGTSGTPFLGDSPAVLGAIDAFLGLDVREVIEPIQRKKPGSLATILFTDLTSSTALTQRLGDAKAQELVREHNAIVREALRAHDGSEIKHTGDGIMASFPSASGALECAIAIQRAVAERRDEQLSVHIGLNAGEPVAEEQDLFGTSVQLARRICDQAAGEEILASDVVRQLAAGKGFLFSDIGEVVPKGFEEPVRLYEVRWREEG